jgi:hypothetical protein
MEKRQNKKARFHVLKKDIVSRRNREILLIGSIIVDDPDFVKTEGFKVRQANVNAMADMLDTLEEMEVESRQQAQA